MPTDTAKNISAKREDLNRRIEKANTVISTAREKYYEAMDLAVPLAHELDALDEQEGE